MALLSHDHRFGADTHIHPPIDLGDFRIEHRLIGPDALRPASMQCVIATVALAGRTPIQREANGVLRRGFIEPGMVSVDPVGLDETVSRIEASVEFLHMYLAPSLLALSASADYELDPAKVDLAYAGGIRDPLILQIAYAMRAIASRPEEPTDQLFLDGARSMLAAHLISKYSKNIWKFSKVQTDLCELRLSRTIDYIETHFVEPISLAVLSSHACLSEFHFIRLFQKATGLSPHRYVTERRIRHAQFRLTQGRLSMLEIASEAGFGSQSNFNRLFRKHTGLTPSQFRAAYRR